MSAERSRYWLSGEWFNDMRAAYLDAAQGYPCAGCGKPFDSPEARLVHAAFTECYGEKS